MTKLFDILRSMLGRSWLPALTETDELNIADYPLLFDEQKIRAFYEECLGRYQGQQEICLPLAILGMFEVSEPPVREVLRLTDRLRQADRVTLSIPPVSSGHAEEAKQTCLKVLFV